MRNAEICRSGHELRTLRSTVTKAVKSVDSEATVDVDLSNKTVTVETLADTAGISKAIEVAGYPNQAA